MLTQLLATSLSEAECRTRAFYDTWIGNSGFLSIIGRLIFRLSGTVYSRAFIRAARLTADQNVLEIGCGMGTILTTAQRRLCSTSRYLGVDLSPQMVIQGRSRILKSYCPRPVDLLVGSGLALPLCDAIFDVVLFSHVIKYLTDEQLTEALCEARRVLRSGGRIVIWEFHPVLNPFITRLIIRCCKAQRLRGPDELKDILEAAGFGELASFRIITPWLPWSNVALTGWLELVALMHLVSLMSEAT